MNKSDGLIEGYVCAEQILISIVMSNAGVFFDLIRV